MTIPMMGKPTESNKIKTRVFNCMHEIDKSGLKRKVVLPKMGKPANRATTEEAKDLNRVNRTTNNKNL